MERQEIANAVLWPADAFLGVILGALEKAGLVGVGSEVVYQMIKKALSFNFSVNNDLDIEGAENVPRSGGIILACNHQSWLDVQVLGAAAPRRVHFIAKSEFQTWPVLRHLVQLSQSVFIRRGGDDAALEAITEALREGWAVGIFPEGTIPGEEDVPRMAIDPKTGLLPGHTGVARLALRAGVPIVPVGISGTGRALPPEIYPRLELLRLPRKTPVRIRFGKPIYLDDYAKRTEDRELYREITGQVMQEISGLVDHRTNYVPIDVPLPEPPKQKRLGVLLLHGFTSHTETVSGLIPHLEKVGVPYEMPVLRGHGTRYQDLRGVTAKDWYVDAERALISLWNHVDRVAVVGLSMGGLVALELAMRHPDKIAGVAVVAPALKFADPLTRFTGVLSKLVKYWPSPESFNDPSLKGDDFKNYPKFPTDSFASLYQYGQDIAERLSEVHVPLRILQSKKDQIVAPESANIIYEKVSSPHREIMWYEKSGHEMMQDLEADQVFEDLMEFIQRFRAPTRRASSRRTKAAAQPTASR
jgi:carboxylesterase